MKKINIILIICLISISCIYANSKEKIKERHELLISNNRDDRFLDGKHYYVMDPVLSYNPVNQRNYSSIYIFNTEFCSYHERDNQQVYLTGSWEYPGNRVKFILTSQIKNISEKITNLKYEIIFDLKKEYGIEINIDKNITNNDINFKKLYKAVFKRITELYPLVKQGIHKKNHEFILNIIPEFANICESVCNKKSGLISKNRTGQIAYICKQCYGLGKPNQNKTMAYCSVCKKWQSIDKYKKIDTIKVSHTWISYAGHSYRTYPLGEDVLVGSPSVRVLYKTSNITYFGGMHVGKAHDLKNTLELYAKKVVYTGTNFYIKGTITIRIYKKPSIELAIEHYGKFHEELQKAEELVPKEIMEEASTLYKKLQKIPHIIQNDD